VDTVGAVPASAGDGAAHAARVALLKQVERRWKSGQFLGNHRNRGTRERNSLRQVEARRNDLVEMGRSVLRPYPLIGIRQTPIAKDSKIEIE
jgi:hypothetical protein